MNDLPPVASPQRPRRRIVLWTVLGILAFLILAPILALVIWRASLTAKINRELAAIRAAGLPTSPAELDAFYRQVPDNENAALLVLEAAHMAPAPADRGDQKLREQFNQLGRREPVPAEISNFLAQRVTDNKEALAILHRAAGLTNSRYPVDLSPGVNALLPHLGKVKETASLLREEAVYEAGAGHADRATESVLAGYAAARTLANEPLLISFLVGNAMSAIAGSGLEQVVNRVALDDVQLRRLRQAILAGDNPAALPRALAGERGSSIGVFQDPGGFTSAINAGAGGAGAGPDLGKAAPRALNSLTGFFDRDLLFYLKTMQKFIDATTEPPPDRFDALKTFDADMVEARQKLYVMTALIMPALGKCTDRDADNAARLRTAATAMAIERYRLKHAGKLPESLAKLVPDYLPSVPVDSFTGQPLQFQKRDKGYVVYSVGADRRDDGGTPFQPKKKGASGASPADICFTVER